MQDLDFSSFFKVSHILTASTLSVFVVVIMILIHHENPLSQAGYGTNSSTVHCSKFMAATEETSKLNWSFRVECLHGDI